MDNDANVGALGEGRHGAGVGCDPLFYMTLSTGIGGGIVIEGKPYRGADSYAGELGHIQIDPQGPACLVRLFTAVSSACAADFGSSGDYGRTAKELMDDPEFVAGYVVKLARGSSLRSCCSNRRAS
jgi:glucokinase